MVASNPPLIIAGTLVTDLVASIAYRPLCEATGGEAASLKHAGLVHTQESVDKLETRLGDGPRLLIGHSQGGLAALMLAQQYPARVMGVITLGSPLAGAAACNTWMPISSVRCMAPESRMLQALSIPPGMRVVNIAGATDVLVSARSGFMAGAEHYLLPVGHLSLALHPTSIAFVADMVRYWDWVS